MKNSGLNLRRVEAAVDPQDPFTDDLLDRKNLAQRSTGLLERIEGPLTIALTGAYDSGKDIFPSTLQGASR